MHPIHGTIIAETPRPIADAITDELSTPIAIGKTRFPDPKNIEKIASPYTKIIGLPFYAVNTS